MYTCKMQEKTLLFMITVLCNNVQMYPILFSPFARTSNQCFIYLRQLDCNKHFRMTFTMMHTSPSQSPLLIFLVSYFQTLAFVTELYHCKFDKHQITFIAQKCSDTLSIPSKLESQHYYQNQLESITIMFPLLESQHYHQNHNGVNNY